MENVQLVYGVGINDLKYKESTKSQIEYVTWAGMLRRLYDEKYLERFPSYKDVTIHEDWLIYSIFRKDLRSFKNSNMLKDGWVLDKDICSNLKSYSKDTCCIIPQQVNIFFSTFSTKHNPPYDARVDFYYCYCHYDGKKNYLGRFKTKEESRKAYLGSKIFVVEDMINKYKYILDSRVITRLVECKEVLENEVCML